MAAVLDNDKLAVCSGELQDCEGESIGGGTGGGLSLPQGERI